MSVETLYKEYKDLVYNLALSYVQNKEDAEEIMQDTFVAAYQGLEDFREDAKISTWLYRIAINKSLDHIKARKAKKRFAFITSIFKEDSTAYQYEGKHFDHPGVLLERKEELKRIFSCINDLPVNQKTALILSKIDQVPQKEIAEIMNLNIKAVESLLTRAKKNLQNKLSEGKG